MLTYIDCRHGMPGVFIILFILIKAAVVIEKCQALALATIRRIESMGSRKFAE